MWRIDDTHETGEGRLFCGTFSTKIGRGDASCFVKLLNLRWKLVLEQENCETPNY